MAKKAPRRQKPQHPPLTTAILTGAPLPADVHPFEAHRVTHPEEAGLLSGQRQTFVEIWREFHGRPITAEELTAVQARAPEIDAAVATTRARRGGQRPTGPALSNWPAGETEGFTPIARLEDDDE
jgi:hypothetical protein